MNTCSPAPCGAAGGRLTSIAGQGGRTESRVAIGPRASVHKLVQAVVIHCWTLEFSSERNQGQVIPRCPNRYVKLPAERATVTLYTSRPGDTCPPVAQEI